MSKIFFRCLFFSCFCSTVAVAQNSGSAWVDSVLTQLTVEEKIGQLMMVPVSATTTAGDIDKLIQDYHIGGVVFLHGGPQRQVNLTNHFQHTTKVPLLVGQEAEWGLGMMLDSALSFPHALVLGALSGDSLVYQTGAEIGREMKLMGVHINFAPVADVNANPENEISYRSFGADKTNVATKAVAFVRGMKAEGVMSCAKDFPVNGLTVVGAKNGLPVTSMFVDSVRSYPFRQLIAEGLTGIVPASADFPLFYESKVQIKKNKFSATALTSIFAGEWLKTQLHFEGLVFVDIPRMQGSTKKYRAGEAEMFAFQAGNDVLLSPVNIGAAVKKIKKLISKDPTYLSILETSVRKVLQAKANAGLKHHTDIKVDNLVAKLNTMQGALLKQKLFEGAVTVLKNDHQFIPVRDLEGQQFLYIGDNDMTASDFLRYLRKYASIDVLSIDEAARGDLMTLLQPNTTVFVGTFPQTAAKQLDKLLPMLAKAAATHEVVVCDFGYPALLARVNSFATVITGYVNEPEMLRTMPEVIFGGIATQGKLPYTASSTFTTGTGVAIASSNRFSYAMPEAVGMDSETLRKIESIAQEAINMKATPGCQVLVARKGKIVYEHSFGYLTYENKSAVNENTIYDLASVTKVSATLQAVMFLYEKGFIDLQRKISYYLPEFKNTNKQDFTVKDILTHQAGLWPFLPFWAQTMKDSTFMPEYYSSTASEAYPLQVADHLFATASMKDSLWHWIVNSKIREKPVRTPFDYKYSDMGFYIMQHLAEKMLNQPLEDFIQQNLYEPLGSTTTGYLPLLRFPKEQIAPTENDKLFRKSLLVGTVHDQGAAMFGGAAGHAGLFSDAIDLAKLGQMLLQGGTYGGYRFYKPETVKLFTQKQFETSRRGLGWDKPSVGDSNSPTSMYASPATFGHTGFTGTCIWVDPEFDLVYVFLSNRVHPSMTNNKLINANIRPRIQDVIYQSIFNYCQY